MEQDWIYFDANASEPARPAALEALARAGAVTGNPSSVHRAGRQARAVLESARERLAALFGARAENCVMTSGGTEANLLAVAALGGGRRVLASAVEHDAVRAAAVAESIPVDGNGVVLLDVLGRMLAEPDARPALVCLMLANNEVGTIQPVAEAARLCRSHGALLHVDAVQAAGRIAVDLRALGADSLAISGHKFGGVKGAGALLLAGEATRTLTPVMAGGGQEMGRRGGTPALPAIAAMAEAAAEAVGALAAGNAASEMAGWRDAIEAAAVAVGAVACGAAAPRLPNTLSLALPGRAAQTQLIALDLAGFGVSAGSACSSGKVARSHVLEAMGLGPLAGEAIRVSLPWTTREEDVTRFIDAYRAMAARLPARRVTLEETGA
ncbi:cysteine desulfurase [Gluconacetobacter liquefaciens]|uniref:Cysteine desulfurase n=1 Tax=Gluconacetobacter liquefaciens TaxID=89584 RepID=A0A370G3W6_GLULI|nr:cysteine desulfurase family protein [Gluconacetobacter liquefaciens]MBB2186045.1 cysteine desulfurase [Gluconacetobacter liquefaciens]RDI38577.1 cysteine desulfurase [Gluconacetobacter liquefaciens]GEB36992.1 cysteine desulfurase [Gluconacetobacter liquefaciens]